MGRLDNLTAQQARYNAEVSHLREELELAKRRDEQALGDALADGRDEPDPEAPAIEMEIERNTQRSSAMTGQILAARRAVAELVLRDKDKWAERPAAPPSRRPGRLPGLHRRTRTGAGGA